MKQAACGRLMLLPVARAANVELSIDDFSDVAARTPYLGNMKVGHAVIV